MPIAYSSHPPELWEAFAKLILEASYEATFCAGILNYMKTGNKAVYLTLLGGGAFGNAPQRIIGVLERSLQLYKDFELDVAVVSYSFSNKAIQSLMSKAMDNKAWCRLKDLS